MRQQVEVTDSARAMPGSPGLRRGSEGMMPFRGAPPARSSIPAVKLTVPVKGVPVRIPVPVESFDDCDILDIRRPQPDLDLSVAVDGNSEFKARINGNAFRRAILRFREDQANNRQVGRFYIVGRILKAGVITDPGISYDHL